MNRRSFLSMMTCAAVSPIIPKPKYFFLNGLWVADGGVVPIQFFETQLCWRPRGVCPNRQLTVEEVRRYGGVLAQALLGGRNERAGALNFILHPQPVPHEFKDVFAGITFDRRPIIPEGNR